mgnify:FL=1
MPSLPRPALLALMDADDHDYFRTVIEERLEESRAELARLGESTAPIAPDVAIGRLSRLDAMQMQQTALAQKRALEQDLRNLEAALERLERDRYGTCRQCRQPIDFTRLQAQPAAQICARCADRIG